MPEASAEAKVKKVHASDGTPSTATVAAEEDTEVIDEAGIDTVVIDEAGIDTEVIDEAGICGDWSDDEDDGVDLKVVVISIPFECAVEKREWSFDSFRQESDGVI